VSALRKGSDRQHLRCRHDTLAAAAVNPDLQHLGRSWLALGITIVRGCNPEAIDESQGAATKAASRTD